MAKFTEYLLNNYSIFTSLAISITPGSGQIVDAYCCTSCCSLPDDARRRAARDPSETPCIVGQYGTRGGRRRARRRTFSSLRRPAARPRLCHYVLSWRPIWEVRVLLRFYYVLLCFYYVFYYVFTYFNVRILRSSFEGILWISMGRWLDLSRFQPADKWQILVFPWAVLEKVFKQFHRPILSPSGLKICNFLKNYKMFQIRPVFLNEETAGFSLFQTPCSKSLFYQWFLRCFSDFKIF